MHLISMCRAITGRVEIEHLSENNFGSLIPGMAYIRIKQVGDFLTAIAIGIILLPALIVIGFAIRISSPGPALFRQRRMGYRGRPFTVYKFRTMRSAAPATDAANARAAAITVDDDDRITSLGSILRRLRLDELPQVINIARGEMSWIGPRPEAMVLSDWYETEIPFYRYRHIVRPGITGWAQVRQGHVADVADVTSKLQYDFYYIKYFSPWLDVLIVLRTLRTIFTGFGAR